MTPPIEPTAAEREGGPLTAEEALFARILDLRHWTSNSAGAEKRHDCKCEDCKAIKQIVHLARQAVATSQSKRAKQLAEMEAALLAARRENEAAGARVAAWREYAEHVEGCRECGEMSWTQCGEGTSLRLVATGVLIDAECRAWDEVADKPCSVCGERLGAHSAYDFSCPRAAATQEPR